MIPAKTLLFAHNLALLSKNIVASGQQLVPNATLYIPRIEKLGPGEIVLASEVTVMQGASTVFQLVDNMPPPHNVPPATSTLSLSPTGAYLLGLLPRSGEAFDIQCYINAGLSTCELSVGVNDTVQTTRRSSFTQTPSGIPVVALNFLAMTTSSANPNSLSSSQDSGASPMGTPSRSSIPFTSGAVDLRVCIVSILTIILAALKLI